MGGLFVSIKGGYFIVIGIVVLVIISSLCKTGAVDWGHIVTISIAGLIGIFIAAGVKVVLKRNKN